jgi:hypothetical protein
MHGACRGMLHQKYDNECEEAQTRDEPKRAKEYTGSRQHGHDEGREGRNFERVYGL